MIVRHAAMSTPCPVFIVGVPRSGTSRLYLAIQSHHRFSPSRAVDGFDLTESRVFLDPTDIREPQGKAWDYLLHDDAEHAALLRALPAGWIRSLPAQKALRRLTDRSRRVRAAVWRLARNDDAMRTYFAHAARARGVARIVEKTPDHVHRLPEILSAFPDARIVCTVRHPLDVYSSYRRRLGVALQTEPADAPVVRWLQSVGPATFCRAYRATVMQAQQLAARLLVIRYEDFTAAPEATFERICAFVGEPFDPRCVAQRTPGLDSWRQDPLLSGPIRENDKVWSDYMVPAVGAAIENRLADTMRLLDYVRYT